MALARPDKDGAPPTLMDRKVSIDLYERHLEATASWLVRSIEHGRGGSCAYFLPLRGWSRPYPETTGYLIPTLLALSRLLRGFEGERHAVELGSWLLSLQDAEGWWRGGLHPPDADAKPSVFNTAQILQGLVALHDLNQEPRWMEAATRACTWLSAGVDADGLWSHRDYRTTGTPSYYTYAAWPMLEVAVRSADSESRRVAEGVLRATLGRRRANGTFEGWSFSEDEAAFTHTIAYTLQGLTSAATLLDDWETYGEPVEAGLTAIVERVAQDGGRLAGRLDSEWSPAASYVCLTGNAQLALCLLDWERRHEDPRLVDTAARLVEAVCDTQRLHAPLKALRGAVGGSSPIWGRYMLLRYPNWAAKYHCDALLRLISR